jgi:transposase
VIEKMFYSLKNDLTGLPLRAQKIGVIKGMIFVNFVALIIRSRLWELMRSTKLYRDPSLPSIMLELSKIRRMELLGGASSPSR